MAGSFEASGARWVLVAGTGLEAGLSHAEQLMARALGEALARHRYGLVTGGWHGVDYLSTDSFRRLFPPSAVDQHVIQVLSPTQPERLRVGTVVRTPHGGREWLEPLRYADAVVTIGGLGGTFDTWLGALHAGLPRFPIRGTGGDSESAYKKTVNLWELIPVSGLELDDFELLGAEINSESDAADLAGEVVTRLLPRALNAIDLETAPSRADRADMFISYSHDDADWAIRLRTLLRPAERRGFVSTWIDHEIPAGTDWRARITEAMERCSSALFLVSPSFLESRFITEVELPRLDARHRAGEIQLYWALLEPCDWRSSSTLRRIQSLNAVDQPVSAAASPADRQVRLIEIVRKLLETPR